MSFSTENTAPHHLHRLLSEVKDSGEANLADGWSAALGAEWGTLEFAKRHAEVVALAVTTLEQLNALPERARERSLRYANDWWTALIQPRTNWQDRGRGADGVIEQDMLDHLEAAADIIAGNLVGSVAAPRGVDFDAIVEQCNEWLTLLRDMDASEISGPVRDGLISQIDHLVWLIENVALFGGARVSSEASRVVGSLAQASVTMENARPETAGRWKQGFFSFITVLAALSTGVVAVDQGITSGTSIVKEIAGVVSDIQGADASGE